MQKAQITKKELYKLAKFGKDCGDNLCIRAEVFGRKYQASTYQSGVGARSYLKERLVKMVNQHVEVVDR